MDEKSGIGYQNAIQWKSPADMKFFSQITTGGTIIMGRKTWESIGKCLPNRTSIVITSGAKMGHLTSPNLESAIKSATNDPIFIIGGQRVYDEAINRRDIGRLYLTTIAGIYPADRFFPEIPSHFRLISTTLLSETATLNTYENMLENTDEINYLNGLRLCFNGDLKENRTKIRALSVFDLNMQFSIRALGGGAYEVPAITTKKLFLKGVVGELLWFLSGSTNTQYLKENGISIWDGNSSAEYLKKRGLDYPPGEVGPIYGYQWTKWHVNQIQRVIDILRDDPTSRRAVVSAWNVADLDKMALPPCHLVYMFNITHGKLNCKMVMRSCDMFLGAPFNILSTAILTILICRAISDNLELGHIAISITDAHLYENHIYNANEQLTRPTLKKPILKIKKPVKSFSDMAGLQISDFEFDYFSHGKISAKMAI